MTLEDCQMTNWGILSILNKIESLHSPFGKFITDPVIDIKYFPKVCAGWRYMKSRTLASPASDCYEILEPLRDKLKSRRLRRNAHPPAVGRVLRQWFDPFSYDPGFHGTGFHDLRHAVSFGFSGREINNGSYHHWVPALIRLLILIYRNCTMIVFLELFKFSPQSCPADTQ